MNYIILLFIAIFAITGCTQREYFEPTNSVSFNQNSQSMSADVISFNRDGATLDDGSIISQKGFLEFKLPDGFTFLSVSEDMVIGSNNKDKISVNEKIIEINGVVIAATFRDDLIALVHSNNAISLYDLKSEKVVFKEYLGKSFANDIRVASPHFMKNIVLFPSLDGKIAVLSLKDYKLVKNIAVDVDGRFNNIIFLKVVNDTLIAATSNKIISVGDGVLNIKEYEIRDVISNKENIYLATIDGQIIKTDLNLNEIGKKKYQYARVYALAFSNSLYALESQGFLINISEDFKDDKIYDFSFDSEDRVLAIEDTIYYGNNFIKLK